MATALLNTVVEPAVIGWGSSSSSTPRKASTSELGAVTVPVNPIASMSNVALALYFPPRPLTLPGRIDPGGVLDHDPFNSAGGQGAQPLARGHDVVGLLAQHDRGGDTGEGSLKNKKAALHQRLAAHVIPAGGKDVEGDELRGPLG